MRLNRTFVYSAICLSLLTGVFRSSPAVVYSHPQFGGGLGAEVPGQDVLETEIERLSAMYTLTEDQVRHLEVAAVGASKLYRRSEDDVVTIPDWAAGRESFCAFRQGRVYLGSNTAEQCLLDHPVWRHAVDTMVENDRIEHEKRRQFQLRYVTETLLLTIDARLMLTEQQRVTLRRMLADIVKKQLENVHCRQTNWMLLPAAHGVDQLPIAALSELLQEDQLQQWKTLNPMMTALSEFNFNLPVAGGVGFGGGGQGGFGGGGGGFF